MLFLKLEGAVTLKWNIMSRSFELPKLNEHSFHAAWGSADFYGNPEFLHNYANGPDGSMMSAILFDILTLQSAGVQAHANWHTFKVSVHTTWTHVIASCLPLAGISALFTKCIYYFYLGSEYDRSRNVMV